MKLVTRAQASAAWVQMGRPHIDMEQLRLGMAVESEHGGDLLDAAQIAVDHLDELDDYYDRLTVMELRARHGLKPNGSPVRDEFNMLFVVLEYWFPDFGTLSLLEDDNAHDGGRHYAYCGKTQDGADIAFASAANTNLGPENIRAMMAHEMGHALDFRYGKAHLERVLDDTFASDDELRADQIAETVFGFPINYDAKCAYVQTTNPGVHPRPKGLR